MSYLLTEVAMEMLGWRFYDPEGIPRLINFEDGESTVCEGVPTLGALLEAANSYNQTAAVDRSTVNTQAESNKKVAEKPSVPEIIELDDDSPRNPQASGGTVIVKSANENVAVYCAENLGDISELYASGRTIQENSAPHELVQAQAKQHTLDTTAVNNESIINAPDATIPLRIQHVQGGYVPTKARKSFPKRPTTAVGIPQQQFEIVKVPNANNDAQPNFVLKAIKPKAPETSINISRKHKHKLPKSSSTSSSSSGKGDPKVVSAFIDLTDDDTKNLGLEEKLQLEVDKIKSELKHHKNVVYDAIPEVLKYPLPTYQGILKSYREQELKNLQKNYRILQGLCEDTEQKVYKDNSQTYSKYLDVLQKLLSLKHECDFNMEQKDAMSSVPVSGTAARRQVARKKTSPIK